MGERNMRIVFSSAISNLTECNSSFDSGVLRVAYTGRNRNNSFISKETFERCMPSIYNCPIVCRYDRDTNSIGSHDMELVEDKNGDMRIVNLTQPVGVIPESACYWWEEVEDDSGLHEYLCIDALLWKRQEAYKKIKEDGITDESMEISVLEGAWSDGVYVISRFEFTAFCLLGSAEPCFESASLQMFSCEDFKRQLAAMMQEIKESFSQVSSSNEVEDKHNTFSMEGGEKVLEDNMGLLAKYGLTAEQLEFDIAEMQTDELESKLLEKYGTPEEYVASAKAAVADDGDDGDDDGNDEEVEGNGEGAEESFALLGEQFREELIDALCAETIETCFGEMPRYCYVDYSTDPAEVYGYDMEDWKLYGFVYSMSGDQVTVDFETKTRKKFTIVDFDSGDQTAAFASVYEAVTKKYQTASDTISSMENELGVLRQFKTDTENAIAEGEREKVFARFEDLIGVEAFDTLRENCDNISTEDLEEKCYAIRGKYGVPQKFSLDAGQKAPKIKVEKSDIANEPYGGAFAEYGFSPKSEA